MILVTALFTKNTGDPATGLTLTDIDIFLYRRTIADGSITMIWTGVNPTEEIGGGAYGRKYTGEDLDSYTYHAYAQYTGATVLDSDYALQGQATIVDAADVWAYTTRTLTQSAASVISAVSGSDIAILRGDTLNLSLTGLGDISARSKLWFTVKRGFNQADADSLIQIEEAAGLVYLNGADASARSGNGSITVDDEDSGDITVALDEVETDDLAPNTGLYYDVQMLNISGAVITLSSGRARITADVTRVVT